MRTFIAVEPGEALAARLDVELRRLALQAPGSRWVRKDSLHLSLAFLGEVADALIPAVGEALARVTAQHPRHLLQARGSGTFGPLEAPKVLWVGIAGALEALNALQRSLVVELEPLGLAPDHAVFMPHLTLARSRNPRGDAALSRCADVLRGTELGELSVHDVTLFASETHREGMRYRPLATHPLKLIS